MTLSKLIEELQEIREQYPEFAEGCVEVECGDALGVVTGIVAEEFEYAKVVLRCLTIRAVEGGSTPMNSAWATAVPTTRRCG